MNIWIYTLQSVASAIIEPEFVFILLILAFIFYRQNKKTAVMQKMIIGESLNSPLELTVSQLVIGILAGALASIMLTLLGVAFDENSAIYLVFLVSIFFMIWNPKYICFAYSGGVLAILNIILETISKVYAGKTVNFFGSNIDLGNINFIQINITALMTLVAVLHLIEGFMVMLDGGKGAIPVFTNRNNRIIGGFAFKRYWALPIAMFFIVANIQNYTTQQIASPNWWPLLQTSLLVAVVKGAGISLSPFYGVIGYNSITFTKNKDEKTFISGVYIIIYSIILFLLAQLAVYGIIFELLAALFAPLGHEAMLNIQRFFELKGDPRFISGEDGIMILEIAPNSPAKQMGIKTGDVLVEINNKKVTDEQDILNISKEISNCLSLKIKRAEDYKELSYDKMSGDRKLGIVFVPKNIPGDSVVVKYDENRFKEVLDKLKNKGKETDGNNDEHVDTDQNINEESVDDYQDNHIDEHSADKEQSGTADEKENLNDNNDKNGQ